MLALTGTGDSVDVAIRRRDGVLIATFDRNTGSRIAERPLARSGTHALFLADGSLAGIDGSVVWVVRPDGSEWSADNGSALTDLAWMGRDWIVLSAADRQFALRTGVEPRIYTLPQAVTE